MKTKTSLVEVRGYQSTRSVAADWRPVRANDGSPHHVGYVAVPHTHSGDVEVESYAIWSDFSGALKQAAVTKAEPSLDTSFASSTISYDTNRPNKSNLCYRSFEGAWFYEPYPERSVVWPEPKWILGSQGFRPDRTMFRAAKFRGYPSSFVSNTKYDGAPRNLPTTLEKQSAGRQLAAGPSKGLDGLLTSIIEMKDVPATLTGLFSFAKFVLNLRKRPSTLLSKSTVREVVGLYLNFTYGVSPTLSECERFRDKLLDELRKARTGVDAMFEAASDSLKRSTREYRKWLAAREKRDEEIRIERERRLALREAERKARQTKARILKQQRDELLALLRVAQMSRQELVDELRNKRLDYYSQLNAESQIRDAFRDQLDDLWSDREQTLLELHQQLQAVADQKSLTFEQIEYYRDLSWIDGYSSDELPGLLVEYDHLTNEIDRIKKEKDDYIEAMRLYRERVLDQLEESYAKSDDIHSYLETLASVEDQVAVEELHILNLQSDLTFTRGQIEKLYDRQGPQRGDKTYHGSVQLTRAYRFPDTYISARRRLHKEPGGAPYMTELDDSGSVSYTVTYSLQDWEITPDPTAEISRLLVLAINRLYRGDMATYCRESIVYKQWPLEALSAYFSPFGKLCDFAHAFLQPLQTMWAVVPWSFVADWFADLSATFGAIETEFTRQALGIPEVDTWSASSFLALLATNLDHPVPVIVEQEWISDPSVMANQHTVRYTFRVNTPSEVELGGSIGDAFVRRPEPSGGVAEFLPPPNLSKVFSHAAEGLALLTQQLIK